MVPLLPEDPTTGLLSIVPPEQGCEPVLYKLSYRVSSNLRSSPVQITADAEPYPAHTPVTLTGLTPSTTYSVATTGVCDNGRSTPASLIAEFDTLPP